MATDMNKNTVTVGFDDDATSIQDIVGALGDAGYVVRRFQELN